MLSTLIYQRTHGKDCKYMTQSSMVIKHNFISPYTDTHTHVHAQTRSKINCINYTHLLATRALFDYGIN